METYTPTRSDFKNTKDGQTFLKVSLYAATMKNMWEAHTLFRAYSCVIQFIHISAYGITVNTIYILKSYAWESSIIPSESPCQYSTELIVKWFSTSLFLARAVFSMGSFLRSLYSLQRVSLAFSLFLLCR